MTTRRLLLCVVGASLAVLCGGRELVAQSPQPSLESLAAGWSAGHSDPTCTPSPNRDPVVQALGMEECRWPRTTYAGGAAQVTGTRYRESGLSFISWALEVRSRAAAIALRDSLATAFRGLGLAEYECLEDGRRWQRAGLGVELGIGVFVDGRLRVSVFATAHPEAIPALMCPGVPTLPALPPAASRRAAAT